MDQKSFHKYSFHNFLNTKEKIQVDKCSFKHIHSYHSHLFSIFSGSDYTLDLKWELLNLFKKIYIKAQYFNIKAFKFATVSGKMCIQNVCMYIPTYIYTYIFINNEFDY